jgi:hypothetical protein
MSGDAHPIAIDIRARSQIGDRRPHVIELFGLQQGIVQRRTGVSCGDCPLCNSFLNGGAFTAR